MKTFNAVTGTVLHFDEKTPPEWAVMYGYAVEEPGNLATWFFNASQAEREARLPVTRGRISVACGDWIARIE